MIVGIDPGVCGAVAFIEGGQLLNVEDMPTLADGPKGRRRVNASLFTAIFTESRGRVTHAFVEDVGTRPGEGAVGAFSFGRGCGVLEGVLAALGIPYAFIRPAEWKRLVGIPSGATKDASRSLAIRTWPTWAKTFARVKDDGRGEAALIALAGIKRSGK
jgi:crossover junction endodeoxyribonuclease RuvC